MTRRPKQLRLDFRMCIPESELLGVDLPSLDAQYGRRAKNSKHPLHAYRRQRENAQKRGVEWKLTLAEWWQVWVTSGYWRERGRLGHQYCMARNGDVGPYAIDNVRIITNIENIREAKPIRWPDDKGVVPF